MSFWNRIFHRKEEGFYPSQELFGRFSDVHKSPDRYARFDASLAAFNQGNYRQALIDFLEYVRNPQGNNVSYDPAARVLSFELVQGSRVLTGALENDRIVVRSQIVDGTGFSIRLLRRLLEKNYTLNYARFCLDEEKQLHAVFESYVQDANPYKLYYGMKELALKADKNDDLILDEYRDFDQLDVDQVTPLVAQTINTKTAFYYSALREVKMSIEEGDLRKSTEIHSVIYALLGTFYKIDVLLCPNGRSTDIIETAHRRYFGDTTRSIDRRMSGLVKALDRLLALEESDLDREWYDVVYTFGLNPSLNLYQAKDFIQTELSRIQWHMEQGELIKAHYIIQFTIGYILFNYAVDRLLFGLLMMYYRVSDYKFFQAMDCRSHFIDKKGGLLRKSLISEIEDIIDMYDDEYHNVNVPMQMLDTRSTVHFGLSLLLMINASSFVPIESDR